MEIKLHDSISHCNKLQVLWLSKHQAPMQNTAVRGSLCKTNIPPSAWEAAMGPNDLDHVSPISETSPTKARLLGAEDAPHSDP